MAAVCGWSKNTLKKHRQELEKRGLISGEFGQAGSNSSGKYCLCCSLSNVSDVDTLPLSNVSDVDTLPLSNVSDVDTLPPENAPNVSDNVSNVDTLYIEKEKVVVENSAASAAAPTNSDLNSSKDEASQPTPSLKKPGKSKSVKGGATAEEIAALPLPFAGADFAELWRNFLTGSKQQGKTLYAYQLMLKHLGKRGDEGFACQMLERATVGNWQGVENAGTVRDFTEWQQQQASKPRQPMPTTTASAVPTGPVLSAEAVARNQEQAAAELAQRGAAFQARQQPVAA
jgi:hypothetical protein